MYISHYFYDTKLMEAIIIATGISSGPWKLDEEILHTETKMMQRSSSVSNAQTSRHLRCNNHNWKTRANATGCSLQAQSTVGLNQK